MRLVGWIFVESICPWTNVFTTDISTDGRFGNCPMEHLVEKLIVCDLNGYAVNALDLDGMGDFLDSMFEMCGANIKMSESELQKITLDRRHAFCNWQYPNYGAAAQVTLIDKKYVFVNMSTSDFWKSAEAELQSKFNAANLGGCLLKIGYSSAVDKLIDGMLSQS